MGEKNRIFKQRVKQVGYWNYTELYNLCFDWLKDNGYNTKENEYTEKQKPNGKEIILKWVAKKKVTDYLMNVIELEWHILGMKDVEVEEDGKKVGTNKGEVKIDFTVDLEKDYEENWDKKPIWKFMRGVYDKYVARTTIDEYEDRIEDDALEFIAQVKGFLRLHK